MKNNAARLALRIAVCLPFGAPLFAGCDNGLVAPVSELAHLNGGALTMGSTASCQDADGLACAADRAPHAVRLSPFKIDKTEVSRLQYAACVVAGACDESAAPAFDPDRQNEPVLVKDPAAARRYCRWRGLGLPTEAQFEFAARVRADGTAHDYPWGDDKPTCDRVQFAGCSDTTVHAVGTTPGDTSAAGVTDLAGGAPEWVDDTWDPRQGCQGRVGWSDVCEGQPAGCEGAHCADASCVHGCLPPDEATASVQGGSRADVPQCQLVSASENAPLDPVIRTGSSFAVVRGGSRLDRACSLAGWSRRHAAPGTFPAGFRCAATEAGFASTPPGSFRFRLANCPSPDHLVTVRVGDADDGEKDMDFVLDHAGASGPLITVHADAGEVRMLPCGDAFVVRPTRAATLSVRVTDYLGCAAWSKRVGLLLGGDVPSTGLELLALAGGSSCTLPHGGGSCAGVCQVDKCEAGWADCDQAFANGCETDTRHDTANCGGCGTTCTDSPNATIACLDGTCGVAACSARFADCDGRLGNGCETDLDTSAANCGGCRVACSSSHIGTPSCSAGTCAGDCDTGWTDCNGNKLKDGCEVQTAADPANCGGCGLACSQKNISVACTGGSCSGRCLPNFADCNNDKRADGCETSLETDPKNCGFCGNACANGKSCLSGQCL